MSDDQQYAELLELEEALERALAVAGPEEVSRRITSLLPGIRARVEERRLDGLDELSTYLEARYGPVPEELILQAMREWPDYEDE